MGGKKPEISCNLCDTGLHGCSKEDYDISVMSGICKQCWEILSEPKIMFAIKTELIIALTFKNDQSLNKDRNGETNNRKEEEMKENNNRRREQREQREREQREQREKDMREMNTLTVIEVQAMIHPEPTRSEPQDEIIIEDMEIVGEEQTESKEKGKEGKGEKEKRRKGEKEK